MPHPPRRAGDEHPTQLGAVARVRPVQRPLPGTMRYASSSPDGALCSRASSLLTNERARHGYRIDTRSALDAHRTRASTVSKRLKLHAGEHVTSPEPAVSPRIPV